MRIIGSLYDNFVTPLKSISTFQQRNEDLFKGIDRVKEHLTRGYKRNIFKPIDTFKKIKTDHHTLQNNKKHIKNIF